MLNEILYQVIVRPLYTEKSIKISENANYYAFEVARTATKPLIKQAVEQLFSVKVLAVKTVNIKGKTKMFRNKPGKQSDKKKAYVKLQAGQTIDLSGMQEKKEQ